MQRLGIAYDARKYVPHVTIARLKSMPAPAVAEFMNTRGYFRPVTFVVDEFILYSSGKSKGGGPYRVEAEYQLRE